MQGTTLGPYRIASQLGSGGMGTVWLATRGDERVALKIVHPHLFATPGFFKRFLREGEIGKRIRHENVVATLDVDAIETGGKTLHFLAMEYVEGQTLRGLLEELGRVPEELCRHIGREVAKGLAAIHAAGVVHRDVKPENVLITKEHVVKVMDLNFLFGSYPPGGAATASGAFSTAYREQFGETDLAETLKPYLTVTPLLVPAFAALLSGDATPSGVEPLTKDSLQTCFVHATRNLAAQRTTIVLIDDLHFAPEEGRSLFAALAMAAPGHRIVVVGTTRPGLDEKWLSNLARLEQTSRLPLARLGPKDLVRLLADTLKSEHLAEELAGKIGVKSDGNPFFVFEILRGLRDGQFLTKKPDGTWVTTRVIADIQIPSSILELVQARLGDLDEEERELLDVAACCGFEFDPLLVASTLAVAQIPAMKRFGKIERRHRLIRSAGRRMVFDHHQVQESIYGSLFEQLREGYHAAIAEAMETKHAAATKDPATLDGALCVDIAEHFFTSRTSGSRMSGSDLLLPHQTSARCRVTVEVRKE